MNEGTSMIAPYKTKNPTGSRSHLFKKANFFYESRFCCQYNNMGNLSSKEKCESHYSGTCNCDVRHLLTATYNEKTRKPQLIYGSRGIYEKMQISIGDSQNQALKPILNQGTRIKPEARESPNEPHRRCHMNHKVDVMEHSNFQQFESRKIRDEVKNV